MPDRIIRDDLLRSARWCKLPSDTDRLAYVVLRLRSDDFGNLEGGLWNVYRSLMECTTIKTEEIAATVLAHLVDADLIRFYKVGDHDYIHCARPRPTNSYLVRKCPPSPWCDPDAKLGKHVRSVRNQGHAKNLPVTLRERNSDVKQGVGVGVGVGEVVKSKPLAPRAKAPDAGNTATIETVIQIPLVDGSEFPVDTAFAGELEKLFPAVDMLQTLREIRAWNLSNPKRRKTKSGIKHHINQWFAKEQNNG